MKKQILSIVLTLCMVLVLCPVTAFAEDYYTITLNFQYGNVGSKPQAENPYTFTVLENETFMLPKVENCAPYEFVGWKESVSGTVYSPCDSLDVVTSNLTFDAVYQVQGSIAVTVNGFEVGNTPNDITFSFASTIPGIEFSKDDIQFFYWQKCIFGEETSNLWHHVYETEAFEAGASYRISMNLDNKGLDMAPAVTVNGRTPYYCKIATRDGVPIQLQIACTLGTPAEPSQYTITYDGGEGVEGSIPAGTKTPGEDFTLSSETFTWDGYVQTGWVDKETGAIYDLGATYDEDRDATLYPYWEKLVTVTAPFTTTVTLGDAGEPGETTFELALIGDSAPDKDKSNVTITGSVTTNGKGSYNGTLTITGTERTLWDMLSEGAFVQQVDAGEAGWTVDDTVWGVRLYMPEVAARAADEVSYELLLYPTNVMSDGSFDLDLNAGPVEEMTFTNTYTAHDYALKHDATHHWDECACKDVQNKELHKYGDWTVTKEATEQEAGEKEHTCTVCGYTEKAEIEKLPATTEPTKPGTDTKPGKDNPATGDNSHMALWIALLFMSGAGVIGTTVYGKKKRAK